MWQQACSFVACVAVSFEACCFVLRLCGGKLVVCIVPVWHQACSFALRLCGSEKEKETKEKKKFCCLCGCELKACCFGLCLCGGKLVVCITPVWRRKRKKIEKKKFCCLCGCCFVLRPWGGKLVVSITAPVGRQARSFGLRLCGGKIVVFRLCACELIFSGLPVWLSACVFVLSLRDDKLVLVRLERFSLDCRK